MQAMWVLIVMTDLKGTFAGPRIQSVPGFFSQSSCETAGAEIGAVARQFDRDMRTLCVYTGNHPPA
jgi:hypothetical protein